jgi:hypothetical protein
MEFSLFFFFFLHPKLEDTLKLKVHKKLMKMPKKMLYDLHKFFAKTQIVTFERKQINFNILNFLT